MTTKNTENKNNISSKDENIISLGNNESHKVKKTRKCSICKKEGHDKRKCESNNIILPSETNTKDIPITKEIITFDNKYVLLRIEQNKISKNLKIIKELK